MEAIDQSHPVPSTTQEKAKEVEHKKEEEERVDKMKGQKVAEEEATSQCFEKLDKEDKAAEIENRNAVSCF